MYQCPGCGADMRFNVDKQQLYCSHCDKTMNVEEYDKNYRKSTERETTVSDNGNDTIKVNICTCSQCGAELISDVNTVATFCSYCGNPQMLSSKIGDIKRPDAVVPFKVNEEQAETLYKNYVRGKFFAPRDFRDKSVIEKIRGIYMPHSIIDYEYNGDITSEGTKCYSRGNYDYTDYYDLKANVNCDLEMSGHDTSLAYDDLLSESIAPYNLEEAKVFNEGYLTGFYADASDVSGGSYIRMYDDEISKIIGKKVKTLDKEYNKYGVSDEEAGMGVVRAATPKAKNAFFPVWFIACKHNNNRISYGVINGQTGDVSVELPISYLKFIIVSLILAAAIFFTYITFIPFTFTPINMLITAFVINVICIIISSKISSNVFKREKEINGEVIVEKKKKASSGNTTFITLSIIACFFAGPEIYSEFGFPGFIVLISIILLIEAFIIFIGQCKRNKELGKKFTFKSFISLIRNLSSIGVSILTLAFATFHDEYYYYAAIFVIVMTLLSFYDIIHSYNLLTTRKLPQFNKRGGE